MRKLGILLLVLVAAIALQGCEDLLGSASDNGDQTEDQTDDQNGDDTGGTDGDDGSDGSDTSDGGFFVPGDDDSGSGTSGAATATGGAVDGTAYAYMFFDYYGGGASEGYNTDVILFSSQDGSTGSIMYLELSDQTDSVDLDSGTYTVSTTGEYAPGVLTFAVIVDGWDADGNFQYAAATLPESTFEGELGSGVGDYDEITGGSVNITRSGSTYTISWSFSSTGGSLSGSYTGTVNDFYDNTGSDGSDGGSDGTISGDVVEAGQSYNLTISSFGVQNFVFTPSTSGTYTIAITNTSAGGDMGWQMYDESSFLVGAEDEFSDNSDEIGTVELTGGMTYVIRVDEWADPGTTVNYTLTITAGS